MKWLSVLLLFPMLAWGEVSVNGVVTDLVVTDIKLESRGFTCEKKYFWSEGDPHFRGQLDSVCIDIRTLEGIPYDVCNGLGAYVAATEWQAAGNRCWTAEEIQNQDQCDGFSPQPPGCS